MANADSKAFGGRSNRNTSDKKHITTQGFADTGSKAAKPSMPAGPKSPNAAGDGNGPLKSGY